MGVNASKCMRQTPFVVIEQYISSLMKCEYITMKERQGRREKGEGRREKYTFAEIVYELIEYQL